MSGIIVAFANQKGEVAKKTTTYNPGYELSRRGHRVLLVDCDPQGSLTIACGVDEPDELENTMAELMRTVKDDETVEGPALYLHHIDKFDLLPSNIALAALEVDLVSTMCREQVLKTSLRYF